MRHRKTILILTTLTAAILVLAGMQQTLRPDNAIHQPIRFDHAIHAKEGIQCLQCHSGADKSPFATLPGINSCLMCHNEPKGIDPEESKVRDFAKNDGAIPWVQVNQVAGHVYFSHGMHVKLGKIDCARCHGDMAAATQPVGQAQIGPLTMTACMQCHEQHNVNQECLTCHK